MSQHDMSLANQAGAAFRSDANDALAALVSLSSGASAPATTFAYMWWADTTTGLLKIRNAANSAWVTVGTLATANLALLPLTGGTLTGNLVMTSSRHTGNSITSGAGGIETYFASDEGTIQAYNRDATTYKPLTIGGSVLKMFISGVVKGYMDTSGTLLIGKTTADSGTAGIELWQSAGLYTTRASNPPLVVNRLTDDGAVININQDGTTEGSISVSGTTVSYNAFLGSHWSQLAGGVRAEILPGTILETIDEFCAWDGEVNDRLPRCQVAALTGSPRVYGVFLGWDEDEHNLVQATEDREVEDEVIEEQGGRLVSVKRRRIVPRPVFTEHKVWNEDGAPCLEKISDEQFDEAGEKTADAVFVQKTHREPVMVKRENGSNDLYCAAIGAYRIRIKAGETPKNGDLIEMSDTPGCGRVQADTVIRSSTVGKIDAALVIETYDDGSFTMPATLCCG